MSAVRVSSAAAEDGSAAAGAGSAAAGVGSAAAGGGSAAAGAGSGVDRPHRHADRTPVRLGEFASDQEAWLLVGRLVAEGVGARAEGSAVWVVAADLDDAVVMTRLFREVDQGVSRVAPPPATLWFGPAWRRMAGVVVLALLIVPTVFVLLAATGR